jgi:hypothetical protein
MEIENRLDFICLKVAYGVGRNICDDISAKFGSDYVKYCLIIFVSVFLSYEIILNLRQPYADSEVTTCRLKQV